MRAVFALLAVVLAVALIAGGCGPAADEPAGVPASDDPGVIIFAAEDGYLRAIRPDGRGLQPFKLSEPCFAPIDFSADGRMVACGASGPREPPSIYLMKRDGSGGHRMPLPASVYPPDVSLSPGGSQLVFSKTVSDDSFEIWKVRTDGKDAERLVAGPGYDYPRWSPNGDQIAFVRGAELSPCATGDDNFDNTSELVVLEMKGRRERAIARTDFYAPEWSPDGKRIAFVDGCSTIRTVSAEGGASKVLGQDPYVNDLAWSPDSKFVAFFRQEDPCSDGVKRGFEEASSLPECERLVVVPATGGESRAIGSIATSSSHLFWLPSSAVSVEPGGVALR